MKVSLQAVDTQLWHLTPVSLGYDVTYFPMGEGGKAYTQLVRSFSTNLSKNILHT